MFLTDLFDMQNNMTTNLKQLERQLAYGAARSDIECMCPRERHSGKHHGPWYNIAACNDDETIIGWVEQATHYLQLRGLLKQHPEYPELYKIKPDDKEQA